MRTPARQSIVRTRAGVLAAAAALLVAMVAPVGTAAASPAPTPTPAPTPRHALAMGKFVASSFAAQAAHLPAGLTTALKRDLGVSPAEYLADAAAAAQAVKVVASLKSAGVRVLGSSIHGTQLTVNVASSADSASVDATGATAVVGAPLVPDVSHKDFKSVVSTTPTYGGEGWFGQSADQIGSSQGFRCSIGFSGYSSSASQFATAGHCAVPLSGNATLITQNAPSNAGGTLTVTNQALGATVAGEAGYGNHLDYGIVGEGSSFVPQAGVYSWGGGTGAPLASAALPIVGQTAAVVGASLCKSGATSGWTCGVVRAVDQNIAVDDSDDATNGTHHFVNTILASTCLLPGDSGGGAVIGELAAGIDSGSDFPTTSCSNPNAGNLNTEYESVFFPIVSAAGSNSVTGQLGANWKLLAAPLVTAPSAGGTVTSGTVTMTGTLFNAMSNAQISLYLDGSDSAAAQVDGSSGTWSIPLSGLAQGTHTYSVNETLAGNQVAAVTGSFTVVTSVPTVTSPASGAKVYPTSVMTGTITSPVAASTALLYLDGSATAYAKVNASTGSWSIPLTGIPVGSHTYSLAAGSNSTPGAAVTGTLLETAVPPTASHIDAITGGVGMVTVSGWATWADQPSVSVFMAIQIGNNWTAMTANTSNTDSGQPAGTGTNHGFTGTVSLAPGSYSVCVWAGNSAGGSASIGCQTVTVFATPPPPPTQAHIDSITGGVGQVSFAGWAVWPDKLSSSVTLAVNIGSSWTAFTANQANSDSGQPAGAGTNHGFAGSISLAPGTYSVCIWTNGSAGGAASAGCQSVTVLSAPPTQAHIDSITGGVGQVSFAGWAVWPDKLSSSVTLAVNIGSSWTAFTANQANSDSGQPAGAGTNHGFAGSISLAPGTYSVCIWTNGSAGGAASAGCQSVTVLSAPPTQAHIDSITGGVGQVSFAGWAVWPDKLSSSVTLAVNIGSSWTAFTANQANSDSGQPAGAGTNHGFAGSISLAPGTYSVCIWTNGSAGGAASAGCQSVTVLSAPPTQAHIDSITGGVGQVSFAGWAVWPDKLSTAVNIAVNIGNGWTGFSANQANSDSGQPAGAGTNHGFTGSIALAPGTYSVCIWAGGSAGGATSIGCQTITVLSAPPMQSHIDAIAGHAGFAEATGWAVWPDKLSTSVGMALQVDNNTWVGGTANQSNTDSGQPAGAGTNHGFDLDYNLSAGKHTICVWATQSVGPAVSIGCATVTVTAPTV